MGVLFIYKPTSYFHTDKVSIIGQFNDFNPTATPMIKDNDLWYIELELPEGEHQYKFILNDTIRLNDPNANFYLPDDEGEVWSIAVVNSNGEREEDNSKGNIELLNNIITQRAGGNFIDTRYKDNFNIKMDSTVAVGFEFGHIIGVHAITAIWMTPHMNVHHICEHMLKVSEGDENDAADVWFWIDLTDKEREFPEGVWNVKLFVDGEYVMENRFTLGTSGTYLPTNKGIITNSSFNKSN